MNITQWPENERPREKLLMRGVAALSDAELLAIFLRVGTRGKNAVELARELLLHFGSLSRLLSASEKELCATQGMGRAKYAQLQATLEIARRTLCEEMQHGNALDSPETVRAYLQLMLGNRPRETFLVLFLNNQNHVITSEELFHGTLNQTAVYPREVVTRTLALNAAAVILAHNHPSGTPEPSQADIRLTQVLKQALSLVEVRVLDHLIVTSSGCLSFAERGIL